jgi:hypothetical protein
MPRVGVDSGQFQREELKRDQFDLFQIEFSCCYLAVRLIAVKDWAKPPSDHVDPYHYPILSWEILRMQHENKQNKKF